MSEAQEQEVTCVSKQTMRKELFQLASTAAKLEGEVKIQKIEVEVERKEKESLRKENRELIALLEKEKKDKNQLFIKINSSSYNHTRDTMEAKRYQTLANSLTQENQSLKSTLERILEEKAQYTKEKQQLTNKLIIAQSKTEISKGQQEIIIALSKSVATLQFQNKQLKSELQNCNNKFKTGLQPIEKTLIKDDNDTREQLIKEFQAKIASKQKNNAQIKNHYEQKITELNLKIAMLSAQLHKET